MAKTTAAHTKSDVPRIQFTPEYPGAPQIIKHMIGLARVRGDGKEVRYLSDARKTFLIWIEEQRAQDARAARELQAENDRKAAESKAKSDALYVAPGKVHPGLYPENQPAEA